MQARTTEVDDALPVGGCDECVTDIPLIRHGPIKDLGSGGDLRTLERYVLFEDVERRSHAAPGQAAAERIEPLHQLERFGPSLGISRSLLRVHPNAPVSSPRVSHTQVITSIALRQ